VAVSVRDPIFDSLWEATLWKLWAEPGIWEPFWDAPNFVPDAAAAEEAEAVLHRLRDEGWALFVRRQWTQSDHREIGEVMSVSDVEAAISDRRWQCSAPIPDDCNVWLVPTDRWWAWRQQQDGASRPTIRQRYPDRDS
jgi:hypothetical protein